MYFVNLQQQLDQDCPIKYDYQQNNTFIVHDKRSKLTAIESEMGFVGVFSSIYGAILNCAPGDRIFVHKGSYEIEHAIKCEVNISIIRLDKMCEILIDATY